MKFMAAATLRPVAPRGGRRWLRSACVLGPGLLLAGGLAGCAVPRGVACDR
jgi:hypothetical protein